MKIHALILSTFIVLYGCGKVHQMKMSGQNTSPLTNTVSDERLVEVMEGNAFRGESIQDSYLEFNQKQYRIKSIDPSTIEQWQALPLSQKSLVHFKGEFKQIDSSLDPQVKLDAIELQLVRLK